MFSHLQLRWRWRPIPNCPGRFTLMDGPTSLRPDDIVANALPVTEHIVAAARDPVAVIAFDDGGLISYRRRDGTYVHTLNTPEGFERKLQQLGIAH